MAHPLPSSPSSNTASPPTTPSVPRSEVVPDAPRMPPNPSAPDVQEVPVEKWKGGRHSRFTPEEDLIIVREVFASNAHVAAFGKTRVMFESAARNANANSLLRARVTWKSVQDRYKRLQDLFDKGEDANQKLSGVGGGHLGEMGELLLTMREARDDLDEEKRAGAKQRKAIDEAKERAGAELVASAMKRKQREGSEEEEDGDVGEGEVSARKQRRLRGSFNRGAGGDMDCFGQHLRDADMARVELYRERLSFERERYEAERADRERDREERRNEREETAKLELEKYKLLIQAFAKK